MNAKDFMLGDWVKAKRNKPFQIGIIDPDFMYWDEVDPIPLTKDILYENFPNTTDNAYWSKVDWSWDDEKSNEEEDWYEFRIVGKNVKVNMTIRYVHELQHALRLCGIGKEIELQTH